MFFDPSTLGWISIAISTLITLIPYFTSNLLNITNGESSLDYIDCQTANYKVKKINFDLDKCNKFLYRNGRKKTIFCKKY